MERRACVFAFGAPVDGAAMRPAGPDWDGETVLPRPATSANQTQKGEAPQAQSTCSVRRADEERRHMRERAAPRFGALVIVCAIVALILVLPRRYHLMPTWFAYVGITVMVVPMLLVALTPGNALWRRLERIAEFVAVGSALFFNSANILVAAYNLVENPGSLEPVPLFYTSVGVWTGNILIFTLIYWLVDSGGPDARLRRAAPYYPDFDFPAMDDDAHIPPDWKPTIIDYLFLGFTTSTAFSPTEAMPLTARAKLLVMLQSAISLITIAIVAARTINILK